MYYGSHLRDIQDLNSVLTAISHPCFMQGQVAYLKMVYIPKQQVRASSTCATAPTYFKEIMFQFTSNLPSPTAIKLIPETRY